jgi:hypothetical protein
MMFLYQKIIVLELNLHDGRDFNNFQKFLSLVF